MDILEFAMKMELDGKAFYTKHARETTDADLKRIFQHLAEEEERHYLFFKNMKEGNLAEAAEQVRSSNALKEIKNIFVEMSNDKESKSFGADELSAWTEALIIEEKAEQFYREKANEESEPGKKELLNKIADEEQTHIHMIDSVITYMKFPDTFADSAQFKDFQSLEGH